MPQIASAKEAFEGMPEAVAPAKIAGINGVILFDLTGEGGGQWGVTLADGTLTTSEGAPESPNVTITMAASDFVALVNGEMNAMNAFMQGKLKVAGDMGLAMRLQNLF